MENILQQIDEQRANEFMAKYRELVKEYGFDFVPTFKLVKVEILKEESIIQPLINKNK